MPRSVRTTRRPSGSDARVAPVNPVTLRALTGSDPLGGASLAERLSAVSFGGNPPTPLDMTDALIDLAHRRGLRALGAHVGEAVGNMSTKPAALAEMAIRECDRLLAAGQPVERTFWTSEDGVDDTLRKLDQRDPGNMPSRRSEKRPAPHPRTFRKPSSRSSTRRRWPRSSLASSATRKRNSAAS